MHFKYYFNLAEVNIQELVNYYEASQHLGWRAIMESKIKLIHKNKTWQLTKLLGGKNPITSKWVFKVQKTTFNEEVDKLKARLVEGGF